VKYGGVQPCSLPVLSLPLQCYIIGATDAYSGSKEAVYLGKFGTVLKKVLSTFTTPGSASVL